MQLPLIRTRPLRLAVGHAIAVYFLNLDFDRDSSFRFWARLLDVILRWWWTLSSVMNLIKALAILLPFFSAMWMTTMKTAAMQTWKIFGEFTSIYVNKYILNDRTGTGAYVSAVECWTTCSGCAWKKRVCGLFAFNVLYYLLHFRWCCFFAGIEVNKNARNLSVKISVNGLGMRMKGDFLQGEGIFFWMANKFDCDALFDSGEAWKKCQCWCWMEGRCFGSAELFLVQVFEMVNWLAQYWRQKAVE